MEVFLVYYRGGSFLGVYFFIPFYLQFILDDFWARYKVVGMKRLFYETP